MVRDSNDSFILGETNQAPFNLPEAEKPCCIDDGTNLAYDECAQQILNRNVYGSYTLDPFLPLGLAAAAVHTSL